MSHERRVRNRLRPLLGLASLKWLLLLWLLSALMFVWLYDQSKRSTVMRSAVSEFYSDFYAGRPLSVCAEATVELDERLPELRVKASEFGEAVASSRGPGVGTPWADKGYAFVLFEGRTVQDSRIRVRAVKEQGRWVVCPESVQGLFP